MKLQQEQSYGRLRLGYMPCDIIENKFMFYSSMHCKLMFSSHLVSKQQFHPSTPRSDQNVTSPYNIHALSSKQVMRILRFIRCI